LNVTGNVYVAQEPEQFKYDADGNLTNDGRWSYVWDGENRLIQMTVNTNVGPQYSLSFAYDPKGRRIQKTVSTNGVTIYTDNFLYDSWNLIATLSPSSSLINSFMWGSDLSGSIQGAGLPAIASAAAGGVGGLLEMSYYGSSTTNCFPAYDGNGNVTALINAADGTLAANYEYGAFGEPIRLTGAIAKNNPFRFSTKYDDDESDLLYYGYRYYKPTTGTWPSRDPLEESGFSTEFDTSKFGNISVGFNLQLFVKNDPIDAYDIEGLLDPGKCVVATETAVTVAAGVAALPAEAIVLGVIIVGEGVVITYEICAKPQCGCPACKPYPKGTTGYLGPHKTEPSAPPSAPRPTHYNLFQVNQQPAPSCHCFWNRMSPHYSAVPAQVNLNSGFPTLTP
jgi:RHS repeat-associated protein